MDLLKFLRSECSALALDDEDDVLNFQSRLDHFLSHGFRGFHRLQKEGRIYDEEIDPALIILDFLIKCGHNMDLQMLASWAGAQYCAVEGVRHQRQLNKGKSENQAPTAFKKNR